MNPCSCKKFLKLVWCVFNLNWFIQNLKNSNCSLFSLSINGWVQEKDLWEDSPAIDLSPMQHSLWNQACGPRHRESRDGCWLTILDLLQNAYNGTFLTPWHLGGFGDFRKKNGSFWLPYQRPSSSADCARELFNGSNGSASLVRLHSKKKFLPGGVGFLWVTS